MNSLYVIKMIEQAKEVWVLVDGVEGGNSLHFQVTKTEATRCFRSLVEREIELEDDYFTFYPNKKLYIGGPL